MSEEIDLYSLFPELAHEKLSFFRPGGVIPKIIAEKTGRASVKSIGNSHLILIPNILERLLEPDAPYFYDVMVWVMEESSVIDTVAADVMNSLKYSKLDESLFTFDLPKSNKKFIYVHYGERKCKIEFAHFNGGGYLNLKGHRPMSYTMHKNGKIVRIFNKWRALWIYEFDNFVTGSIHDMEMARATLNRGDSCDENFFTLIEYNEPLQGSPAAWVNDYISKKINEEKIRLDMIAHDPQNVILAGSRPVIYFHHYSLLDFPESDFLKFTNAEQRQDMLQLYMADRDTFNWVYRAKALAMAGVIFKTLDAEKHKGYHENFRPTILTIGVDIGQEDACAAVLSGMEIKDKTVRIQDGLACTWHSNRWGPEGFMPFTPDFKTPGATREEYFVYKTPDQWVANDLVNFIRGCANAYPLNRITVYFEYADKDSAEFVQMLQRVFQYNSNIIIEPDWYKGLVQERITCDQVIFAKPGMYKCCNDQLWEGLTSLRWAVNNKENSDAEAKLHDNTKSRECLYFDLTDARWYNRPYQMQEMLKPYLRFQNFVV